jgi:hypothetical protein
MARAIDLQEDPTEASASSARPRNLAVVTEPTGARAPQPRRRAERLFGAPAEPSAPRRPRTRPEAPRSLRWAALVVAVEATALALGAVAWLWLTLTSSPESVARALAEVVIIALAAAGLGAAAVGLSRVSGWARGPVIAAQVLFGLSGYVAAFEAERPVVGVPILLLVAAELYLLATPESRLAYLER